jgi:hypothetical protein
LALPEVPQLSVSSGVRLPSLNLDLPAVTPTLAQPRIERGSLDYPTAEFSTAMALTAPLPERTRPVPFVRLVLPDPFEHQQTARWKTPAPEEHVPAAAARLPGR